MSNARTEAGFTLVEALVALGVFAMAGVSLVALQGQSLNTLSRAESRALAAMAAQNELVEILAARAPAPVGEREGESEFAGRVWAWRAEIVATSDPETRRATVVVRSADGDAIAQAHAFFSAQAEAAR